MKNNLFKKSMSVFLSVLMILSCWVFAPSQLKLEAKAVSVVEYPLSVTVYNTTQLHNGGDIQVYYYEVKSDGTLDSTLQQYNFVSSLTRDSGANPTYSGNVPGFPVKIAVKVANYTWGTDKTSVRVIKIGEKTIFNDAYTVQDNQTINWAIGTQLGSWSPVGVWENPSWSSSSTIGGATVQVPSCGSRTVSYSAKASWADQYSVAWPQSGVSYSVSGTGISFNQSNDAITGINVSSAAASNITSGTSKNVTVTASGGPGGKTQTANITLNAPKKEVLYDNMFSLSDWYYSESSRYSDSNVTTDLSAGKITIKNPNTSEYTTLVSGSSSNANTRDTNKYAMPVVGGKEYTIKYTTDGADTQMYAIFYDANGGCTHEATFGNYNFTVKNSTGSATFKAPDNSTQMEIRFDNNVNGTANFTNIMVYPASLNTELGIDGWSARPYRQLYNYNASVSSFDTPARAGYSFSSWLEDTNGDGTGDAAPTTGAIKSNKVLYSTWTPSSYAITFDGNGGTASTGTVNYTIEDAIVLPVASKDSYALDSWKVTTADGNWISGDTYSAGQSLSGMYGNPTLTAQWVNEWTVSFLNGDNTTLATVKVKDGKTVGTLPNATPTKASTDDYSYQFDHWYTDTANFDENTVVTADVKVYPAFNSIPHSFVWAETAATDPTCESPALVRKYCKNCNHSLGNVPYDGDKTEWLALGHSYQENDTVKIDGNDQQHAIKCIRYDNCGSTKLVDHKWEGNVSQGATCMIPGTIKKTCPCGAEKFVEGTVDDTNHVNTKLINVKAPDCLNDGYTGDEYCEDCKKTVVTGKVDPKLGHSFTNYVSDGNATCTEDGTKTAKCDRCDVTDEKPDTGSAKGHTWLNEGTVLYKAADCENDAVYYQTCEVCGISAKDDTTNTGSTWTKADSKTGHKYTGDVQCLDNGTHNYLCANGCKTYGYEGVKDNTKSCVYGEWSKTEADTHTKTCEECSHKVTQDHDWSKWETVEGATADAPATQKRSCLVCGREETNGCSYTSTHKDKTCTAPEITTYTCTDCGHAYTVIGEAATGHNYTGEAKSYSNGQHNFLCVNGCNTYGVDETIDARTACTYKYDNNKDGEHQVTCTACKYTFAEECTGGQATCTEAAVCEKCKTAHGATAPHSFTGTPVKLDGDKHAYLCVYCSTEGIYGVGENKGYTEACSGGTATCSALAVCGVCKDTYGELNENAHKYGKWANVEGTQTHQRVCEYNAAHTEEGECYSPNPKVINPDCETAGYTLNTCEFCNHEWQTGHTEPLDHLWSSWVNNEDGTHTRTCLDNSCKYGENGGAKVETVKCSKDNATFVVTDPECLEQGYTTYTCNDCGYVWVDDYTNATGHSYLEKKKKTDAAYKRTDKDCVTDETYWYCCDNCDVSAGTEVEKYENEADLYWVSQEAVGHKFDKKNATDDYLVAKATCTTKAVYYYSCSVCGTSSKDLEGEATFEYGTVLNHDWQNTETFIKSEADCINNEVYYKECSRCHISSENETGATWEKADTKSGHDFKDGYTEGVAATCTEPGVVEHYTCNVCNKHFKADKTTEIAADKLTIAALKHDYKDVAKKDATCEEAGYTAHKQCQREGCGYRNTDYKVIDALGHEFKAENGYFTDLSNGYHAYYCTRYDDCGAYGVDNVKYSAEYDGLDWVIVGGIKCTFTGEYVNYEDENGIHSHKLTCECGNETSAACADDQPEHVLPTCTENGYYVHTCDVCSYEWTVASDAEEDKALDHDFTNAAWTQLAGKDEHIRKCNRCDATETEECATETPATTCGQKNICDKCKSAFGEDIPHAWAEVEDEAYLKTAANCTDDAVYYKKCANCTTKDEKEIWIAEDTATGHAMTDYTYDLSDWDGMPEDFDKASIKKPTCHSEGLSITYCTNEGCSYHKTKREQADADAHVWADEWITIGGDCANGITMIRKCTAEGCNETQSKTEQVAHTWVEIVRVEADCTHDGYSHFKCSVCDYLVIFDSVKYEDTYPIFVDGDVEIDTKHEKALGHDFSGEMVIEKAATCGQEGRGYYVCQTCQAKSEKEILPKVPHQWDQNNDGLTDEGFTPDMLDYTKALYVEAAESTCKYEGHNEYYKCYECSYDQHSDERWTKDNIIAKKDHADNDGNGKCDECNSKFYGEDGNKNCGCICHKEGWFMEFIYKILRFFWKLFKIGHSCDCGAIHY